MRSIWALTLKECRQHGWALMALTALVGLGMMLQLWQLGTAPRMLSLLQGVGAFLILFMPFAALILSGRLIVNEYQSQTQLFIESLPIRRTQMVLTKYVLGLGYLLAMAACLILVASALAAKTEPIGVRFLLILSGRAAIFIYGLWGFLFAMGFMGRFRYPIYLGLFLGLGWLAMATELDIMRVGPLALVDPETFPFERHRLPWEPALHTLILGTVCILLALTLALIHEGSVAETLARKMTQREKVMVGAVLMAGLVAIIALDKKAPKTPYRFESRAVVRSAVVPLSIQYSQEAVKPDADRLLRHLETSLSRLGQVLKLHPLPSINMAFSPALDHQTFETATLNDADGVLVRANFAQLDDTEKKALEAYVLRAVLDRTTRGRSRFEPKRWLTDGFSRWWAEHGLEHEISPPPTRLLLRALTASGESGIDDHILKRWTRFREQQGILMAESLAYTGLRVLENQGGRQHVLELARAVVGRRPPHDIRETLYEWSHPMAHVFQEVTHTTWSEFLTAWQAWLQDQRQRPNVAQALAALPAVHTDFDIVAKDGTIRDITYRIRVEQTSPPTSYVCTLLHHKLPPFDREMVPKTLRREEYLCGTTSPLQHLSGYYSQGERVFIALEIDIDLLQAPIRAFAKRITMP